MALAAPTQHRVRLPAHAHPESANARTPWAQLRALVPEYLRFRSDFNRERRPGQRILRQREWFHALLGALGYRCQPANHILEDGAEVPVLCADGRPAGAPRLLALGAFDATGEGEDPLTLKPHRLQFHGEAPPPEAVLNETWDAIVTRRLFAQTNPPRWILILSCGGVLLLERGKWTHNRLLRFDLDDILSRKEDATLKAAAALLHRESLLPEAAGQSLLDSLDENSHKHAFAVSEDLKHALRECIELVGNDASAICAKSPRSASTAARTPPSPNSSAASACATCTGCCSCSTSRRVRSSATRR